MNYPSIREFAVAVTKMAHRIVGERQPIREIVIPCLKNSLLPDDVNYAPPGTRFEVILDGKLIDTFQMGGVSRELVISRKNHLFARKDYKELKPEIYFIIPSKANT